MSASLATSDEKFRWSQPGKHHFSAARPAAHFSTKQNACAFPCRHANCPPHAGQRYSGTGQAPAEAAPKRIPSISLRAFA